MLRLGAALCSREQYDEGRRVLADLKRKFERYPNLAAPAQYFFARSFDAQDRWDRALSEFQWLLENHPYTEESFKAALYIPRHFAREGDEKLTGIWYERSEQFFRDAARVKQGERVELVAYTYLADLYRLQEKWNRTLEIFEKIHSLAPKSRLGAEAMYHAAAVSYQVLQDSARAEDYLDRIRRQFGTTDSSLVLEEEQTDIDFESIE
jgi:tetratricopeptide (TPR) repeat protein